MIGWDHRLDRHEFEQTQGDSERQKPGVLQFRGMQRLGHDLVTEQQQPQQQEHSLRFLKAPIISHL